MRASKGVLNYAADDWKGKAVSGPVEQDLTSNDSRVHLDVPSPPAEFNSPMEAVSSSFCAKDNGRNSTALSAGGVAADLDGSVPLAIQIEEHKSWC